MPRPPPRGPAGGPPFRGRPRAAPDPAASSTPPSNQAQSSEPAVGDPPRAETGGSGAAFQPGAFQEPPAPNPDIFDSPKVVAAVGRAGTRRPSDIPVLRTLGEEAI